MYPKRVRVGTTNTLFVRRDDLHSVKGIGPDDRTAGGVAVLPNQAGGRFVVYEGGPPSHARNQDFGPVYSIGADGPLAVPTGLVFVRLVEGVTPDQRSAEFATAGFDVERTVAYAPNAAWLRPSRGGIARAFERLSTLRRISGVAHVEPQMLLQKALRRGKGERTRDSPVNP